MEVVSTESKQAVGVVYVIGTLLVGGTERQLVELIKGLDRSRFTPFVCCIFGSGVLQEELETIGVEVKVFSFVGTTGGGLSSKVLVRNIKAFFSLVAYLKKLKPAVLHSNLKLNNLFGATAAKFARIPYIIVGYRNIIDETEKYPFLLWWERKVNSWADTIVTNSQAVRYAVKQRLNPSLNKIRVIHNGIDIAQFKKKKNTQLVIGNISLPITEPVITVVANLIPYKGHEDLIRAINIVCQKNANIKCILVGRDDGFGIHLRELVWKLNLQDKIIFAGALFNIPDILALTDIQVLASYHEGFSNVILEGMAAGIPQVVTDVGGNAEAVVDGETGFVVPPKNPEALAGAILRLLEDEELRKKMGQAGQSRVEKYFSLERMIRETEQIYTELLCSSP